MTPIIPESVPANPIAKKPRKIDWLKAWIKFEFSKLLVWFVKIINDWDRKLTNYAHNPNPQNVEDLGPNANATNNQVYEEFLIWALKKKNVTNVALTGPYGSGKSSVITTFQAKHKEFHYLNISLAMFDKEFKHQEDWRQKVELSILQQLIYHVKNKQLPESRFKKINYTSRIERFLVTIGLVLLGVSFFNIYKPDFVKGFSWWNSFKPQVRELINSLTLGYLLFGVSIIVYKFYRSMKTFRFSKIGLTTGQLELADKDDRSIFNKHLDEIIYFFQVTLFDVIVIEDLDRFEDAEIFTKLREVNNLINNSKQIGRQINFIYAVRDDMFKDKDRAKFFDFIIPVIPVINTSNSGDELGKKLGKLSFENPISGNFLNTVTLYIQDMRLLINILNEFKVYLTQIGKGLDPQKLLAIIIYKNIYPEEFAKLHNQEGDVYQLISSKKTYISAEIARLSQEVASKEAKIQNLNAERLKNLNELKSIYIVAVYSKFPSHSVLRLNNVDVPINNLLDDKNFNLLILQSNISSYYLSGYNSQTNFLSKSFSDIEKEVDSKPYSIRKKNLEEIANNGVQTLRTQIVELNRNIAELQGYTIRQIMNFKDGFTLPESFSDKPLLTFLISSGYIDEHYPMYISYFIEGSLTQADVEFVRSITQRKPLSYEHALTNVDTIVTKWLSIENYAQTEILNINFFDWILQYDERQAEKNILFEEFASISKRSVSFIQEYISKGTQIEKFLILLSDHFPRFWDVLYEDASLNDSQLDHYVQLILSSVTIDQLYSINSLGKFSNYLENKQDPVQLLALLKDQYKFNQTLDKLEVKFFKFPYSHSIRKISWYCYQHNHYILSPENLIAIVNAFPELITPVTLEDFETRQFTVVRQSKANDLLAYIEGNIDDYVSNVLLKISTNIHEDENTLIYLIDHPTLKTELKEQIIIVQQNAISDISTVSEDYFDVLFKHYKAGFNWKNILCFYQDKGEINNLLIDFLNKSVVGRNALLKNDWKALIEAADTKEDASKLEKLLLENNQLNIEVYKVFAEQANFKYKNIDIKSLDQDKVSILTDSGTLDFSKEQLAIFNDNFPTLLFAFVLKNEKDFFESSVVLPDIFYKDVIENPIVVLPDKIRYLKTLSPNDLKGKTRLCGVIGELFHQHQSEIENFTPEFRLSLIHNQANLVDKLNLMLSLGDYLNQENVMTILKTLPEPFNLLFVPNRKPLFVPLTEINNRVLNFIALKLPNIVSTVTLDKKNRLRVNFRNQ